MSFDEKLGRAVAAFCKDRFGSFVVLSSVRREQLPHLMAVQSDFEFKVGRRSNRPPMTMVVALTVTNEEPIMATDPAALAGARAYRLVDLLENKLMDSLDDAGKYEDLRR